MMSAVSITPCGWHLRRPHSQRRQARQLTCPAAEERRTFWKAYSRFMGSSPDFRGRASPHASHYQRLLAYFRQLYFLQAMPHVPVNEEPGFSLIRASPVRNAFGGQVIGSTARL